MADRDDANKNNSDDDSDSTMSDWDMSDSEIEAKKQEKERIKKEAEEAERLRKEREKTTRQKREEKIAKDKAAREARIAELNKMKSAAELAEEEEERHDAEAEDFFSEPKKSVVNGEQNLDDLKQKQMQEMASQLQSLNVNTNHSHPVQPAIPTKPSLFNFQPKVSGKMTRTEAITLAGHFTEKLFEYKKDPNFIVVVDQMFRSICEKHEDEDWEKVRNLGKSVSAIGNQMQTSHKKKTTKKKKGGTKPKQAISRADDFNDDAYEQVDDLGDFM